MDKIDKDRIIARIRKLMAVAENGAATEAEVESYARMARKLIEEHNLQEHEVLASDDNARASAYETIRTEKALKMARLVELQDKRTAMVAAMVCDCRVYWQGYSMVGGRQTAEAVVFYGLAVDVAVCKVFFAELRASIKVMASKRCGKGWGTTHREYAVGFTMGLMEKARAMRDMTPQGYGIVLAKGALLDKWQMANLNFNGKVSQRQGKDYRSSKAYWQGKSDGNRFDLGVDRRITNG